MKNQYIQAVSNGSRNINDRGFTLVEVLIALLVLGILFVPVSNAFLQSAHLNQQLRQRVENIRNAQTAMEVTRAVLSSVDVFDIDDRANASEVDNELFPFGEASLDSIVEDTNELLKGNIVYLDNEKSDNQQTIENKVALELEAISTLLNTIDTDLINPDCTLDITSLNEDSPFLMVTAKSGNTTITSLVLPGEAPWLTPKVYKVVTP